MPTYLAFGDSNTHGSLPLGAGKLYERYPIGTRWPTVAHGMLPEGWHLAEEGLPGRTSSFADPIMGTHMNGWDGFKIALMTHAPIDLITIMLGTNDVKARLGATPEMIAAGIMGLLDFLRDPELTARAGQPKVLVIAPPALNVQDERAAEWLGSREKSLALPALYAQLAEAYGTEFLDAGQHIEVAPVEGIHFTADAHLTLGRVVGERLLEMIR